MSDERTLISALLGPAGASPQAVKPTTVDVTTFVISGHGWGHGVGMAQWGAYGYAKHGVTYDKILAHYYPGTSLAPAPVTKIKVLLVEGAKRVVVSSPASFEVEDATGAVRKLPPGEHARLLADPSLIPSKDLLVIDMAWHTDKIKEASDRFDREMKV